MRDLKNGGWMGRSGKASYQPVGGLMPEATPGHLIRYGANGATLGKIVWSDDRPHYGNRHPGRLFRTRPA